MGKVDSYDRILDKIDAIQQRLDDMEHKILCMIDDLGKIVDKDTWKKAVDIPIGTKVLWSGVEAEVMAHSKYGDEILIIESMDGVDWVNVNDVEVIK